MTETVRVVVGHASAQALGDYDPAARAAAARCPTRDEVIQRGLGRIERSGGVGGVSDPLAEPGSAQCVHVFYLNPAEYERWRAAYRRALDIDT